MFLGEWDFSFLKNNTGIELGAGGGWRSKYHQREYSEKRWPSYSSSLSLSLFRCTVNLFLLGQSVQFEAYDHFTMGCGRDRKFSRQKVSDLGFLTKMWHLLKISDVSVTLRTKHIWQKKEKNLKQKPFPNLGFALVRKLRERGLRDVEKLSAISPQNLKGNVFFYIVAFLSSKQISNGSQFLIKTDCV